MQTTAGAKGQGKVVERGEGRGEERGGGGVLLKKLTLLIKEEKTEGEGLALYS